MALNDGIKQFFLSPSEYSKKAYLILAGVSNYQDISVSLENQDINCVVK